MSGNQFIRRARGWLDRRESDLVEVSEQVAPLLDKVGDHADDARAWITKDDGARKWLAKNWAEISELLDQSYPPEMSDLDRLEKALVGIIKNVQQSSEKRARRLATLIAGKLGGAAGIGGIVGLISTFGAASTGASIASLSGAAATTAKLYWVGSLFGLGTAAGGAALAVGGIGLAIGTAYLTKRYVFGSARNIQKLQDHEQALLVACSTLLAGVQEEQEKGGTITREQTRFLCNYALVPILDNLNSYWTEDDMKRVGVAPAKSYRNCLAALPFQNLRTHKNELTKLVIRAMAE